MGNTGSNSIYQLCNCTQDADLEAFSSDFDRERKEIENGKENKDKDDSGNLKFKTYKNIENNDLDSIDAGSYFNKDNTYSNTPDKSKSNHYYNNSVRLDLEDGSYYEGQLDSRGFYSGQGKLVDNVNKIYYTGNFMNGKKINEGSTFDLDSNNLIYNGQYLDDEKNGNGKN
jgi:hypothetical protein